MLGTTLVALSAVLWSAAGLFTKGAAADAWTVIFWRSVVSIVPILLYVRWKDGPGQWRQLRAMGRPGWAVVLVGAAATYCFITAFKQRNLHLGILDDRSGQLLTAFHSQVNQGLSL